MTDNQVRAQQSGRVEKLDRRHAVLEHGLKELDHTVCGMRGHGHAEFSCRLPRGREQILATALGFARDEQTPNTSLTAAINAVDEVFGGLKVPPARRAIVHPLKLPSFPSDPASRIVARPKIPSDTEAFDLAHQGFLHLHVTTKLHESRRSVPQEFRDRVTR